MVNQVCQGRQDGRPDCCRLCGVEARHHAKDSSLLQGIPRDADYPRLLDEEGIEMQTLPEKHGSRSGRTDFGNRGFDTMLESIS